MMTMAVTFSSVNAVMGALIGLPPPLPLEHSTAYLRLDLVYWPSAITCKMGQIML
jgi:hypothetical protein